jgi:hypothetical protein
MAGRRSTRFLHVRHMPTPAASGADAAAVEGGNQATEVVDTSSAKRLDDRENVVCKGFCFRSLDLPPVAVG